METRFSDYKTVKETAREWGVTERWVMMYCRGGRIPGAFMVGHLWLIPRDAEKPTDGRRKKASEPLSEESE